MVLAAGWRLSLRPFDGNHELEKRIPPDPSSLLLFPFSRPYQEHIPSDRYREAINVAHLLRGGDPDNELTQDKGNPAGHFFSF